MDGLGDECGQLPITITLLTEANSNYDVFFCIDVM